MQIRWGPATYVSAQAQGGGELTDGHLTEVLKYRQQTDTQSDKLR